MYHMIEKEGGTWGPFHVSKGSWIAMSQRNWWQFQGHVWLHFYLKTGGEMMHFDFLIFGSSPTAHLLRSNDILCWIDICFNILNCYTWDGDATEAYSLRFVLPPKEVGLAKGKTMKSHISENCNGATCICTFQTGCKEWRLKCKLGNHGNSLTLIYGIPPNNSKETTFQET